MKCILILILFIPNICLSLDLDIDKAIGHPLDKSIDKEKVHEKDEFLRSFYGPAVVSRLNSCFNMNSLDRSNIKNKSMFKLDFHILEDGSVKDVHAHSKRNPELESSLIRMIIECAPFPKIPDYNGIKTERYKVTSSFELKENQGRNNFNLHMWYR